MTADIRTAAERAIDAYLGDLGLTRADVQRIAKLSSPNRRHERSAERTQERQAESVRKYGQFRYERWTKEEDDIVMNQDLSREEKMRLTGRTLHAVLTRRRRLRGAK